VQLLVAGGGRAHEWKGSRVSGRVDHPPPTSSTCPRVVHDLTARESSPGRRVFALDGGRDRDNLLDAPSRARSSCFVLVRQWFPFMARAQSYRIYIASALDVLALGADLVVLCESEVATLDSLRVARP